MISAHSRLVVATLALALGACGGGGGGTEPGVGVSLEERHTEPLRSGQPVRWTLVLRNDRPRALDIELSSGRDGDVVLRQGGAEVYRWSTDQVFTDAIRPMQVGPNESRTFALEGQLTVPPGEYELEATLATTEEVPPVEKTVTVEP